MKIRLIPKERREGTIIPEGLSITKTKWADYIRIRQGDTIGTIRITVQGYATYTVQTRKDNS
jgi:hypothetical protein